MLAENAQLNLMARGVRFEVDRGGADGNDY